MKRTGKETRTCFLMTQQIRRMKEQETLCFITNEGAYILELVEFRKHGEGREPIAIYYDEYGQLPEKFWKEKL